MRRILLLNLILLILPNVYGQDSIRAANIYKHQIVNGKQLNEKSITEQKTYDLKDRLVLHIYYYDSVPNIKSFTRFYYDEDRRVSEETFTVENEVLNIKRYEYDASGNLISERKYEPIKNKMLTTQHIKYVYSGNKLSGKIILNEKGKWTQKQDISYEGERVITKLKINKKYEPSLRTETVTEYFKEGLIQKKEVLRTYSDQHTLIKQITYTYDPDTGRLAEEIWYIDGAQKKRIVYSWFLNGTMNRKSTYNAENELVEYLSYTYLQRIVILGDEPMYDLSRPLHGSE